MGLQPACQTRSPTRDIRTMRSHRKDSNNVNYLRVQQENIALKFGTAAGSLKLRSCRPEAPHVAALIP